jgi:hypothetical protein
MNDFTPILKTIITKFTKFAFIAFEVNNDETIMTLPFYKEWCDYMNTLIKSNKLLNTKNGLVKQKFEIETCDGMDLFIEILITNTHIVFYPYYAMKFNINIKITKKLIKIFKQMDKFYNPKFTYDYIIYEKYNILIEKMQNNKFKFIIENDNNNNNEKITFDFDENMEYYYSYNDNYLKLSEAKSDNYIKQDNVEYSYNHIFLDKYYEIFYKTSNSVYIVVGQYSKSKIIIYFQNNIVTFMDEQLNKFKFKYSNYLKNKIKLLLQLLKYKPTEYFNISFEINNQDTCEYFNYENNDKLFL